LLSGESEPQEEGSLKMSFIASESSISQSSKQQSKPPVTKTHSNKGLPCRKPPEGITIDKVCLDKFCKTIYIFKDETPNTKDE